MRGLFLGVFQLLNIFTIVTNHYLPEITSINQFIIHFNVVMCSSFSTCKLQVLTLQGISFSIKFNQVHSNIHRLETAISQ